MKLVLVDWVDSHSTGGWREIDEIKKDASHKDRLSCQSVGYLLLNTKDYLLLGMSRTIPLPKEKMEIAETMQIPIAAVVKVRELIISE